jgi:hypothetical protein
MQEKMANRIRFRAYHGAEVVVNLDLMTRAEFLEDEGQPEQASLTIHFDHENSISTDIGEEARRVWKILGGEGPQPVEMRPLRG